MLTRRGARALQDASYLAFASGRGFKAHYTFTMANEARERLDNGEIALSREVRRTLNAMQTYNARHGLPKLAYQWVAENPDSVNGWGGTNPHVHLNTDFIIGYADFDQYAAMVERAWGHGMVHIERLADARAAAAYLLKAVGYVQKGKQAGQGTIRGARYGVSASLRSRVATEWDVHDGDGRFAAGLRAVCGAAPVKGCTDLGRGVFATRYGVGVRPLAGGEVDDLIALVRSHGDSVPLTMIPDSDPRYQWCIKAGQEQADAHARAAAALAGEWGAGVAGPSRLDDLAFLTGDAAF